PPTPALSTTTMPAPVLSLNSLFSTSATRSVWPACNVLLRAAGDLPPSAVTKESVTAIGWSVGLTSTTSDDHLVFLPPAPLNMPSRYWRGRPPSRRAVTRPASSELAQRTSANG